MSLLTWKCDKLNKCVLFNLLLYGFTQNTEYNDLYEYGYFNYFYLSITFYAFSYAILHRMASLSVLATNRYII